MWNLNELRELGAPFNKGIVTHGLTKKQKEKLKNMIHQVHEKEREDVFGVNMYRVRGPP